MISEDIFSKAQASYEQFKANDKTLSKEAISLFEILFDLLSVVIEENKYLKAQLFLNSSNSSKPPSSDGFKKPIKPAIKKDSNKKAGGQNNHKGRTLNLSDTPDEIIVHHLNGCCECGCDLTSVKVQSIERHQIYDIPQPKLFVSEHQVEKKICPKCAYKNTSVFPEEAQYTVQYGKVTLSFLSYLNNYQLIPFDRCCELFEDLFGQPINAGTIENANKKYYNALLPFEDKTKQQLLLENVIHADESGIYIPKREWLHVICNDKLTYYQHHPKRGRKAIDDIEILNNFYGVLVHDGYPSYTKYDCKHALCNCHHLRELTFIEEIEKQKWATVMKKLLLLIKSRVDNAKIHGADKLSDRLIEKYEARYYKIIQLGLANEPIPPPIKEKVRGKKKQTKSKNMLDNLLNKKTETLRFMKDFLVPFDNNQAERDIRMIKVKQKISGCFRANGVKYFLRIRSYISTLKKNNQSILNSIQSLTNQNFFFPDFNIS